MNFNDGKSLVNSDETIYLKKSIKIFRIYIGLLLFSILASVILKSTINLQLPVIDALIGLPAIGFIIMPPVGLFYSWKSYSLKEGIVKTRYKYLILHLFFTLIVALILVVMFGDLSRLIG